MVNVSWLDALNADFVLALVNRLYSSTCLRSTFVCRINLGSLQVDDLSSGVRSE